jgi:hypothetical protein
MVVSRRNNGWKVMSKCQSFDFFFTKKVYFVNAITTLVQFLNFLQKGISLHFNFFFLLILTKVVDGNHNFFLSC